MMNGKLISKFLLGSTAILGTSLGGTYFGTKVSLEDHLSSKFKKKNDRDWKNTFEKISKAIYTSSSFENLKNVKNEDDLKKTCEEIYSSTYKAMWMISIPEADQIDFSSNTNTGNWLDYCFAPKVQNQ